MRRSTVPNLHLRIGERSFYFYENDAQTTNKRANPAQCYQRYANCCDSGPVNYGCLGRNYEKLRLLYSIVVICKITTNLIKSSNWCPIASIKHIYFLDNKSLVLYVLCLVQHKGLWVHGDELLVIRTAKLLTMNLLHFFWQATIYLFPVLWSVQPRVRLTNRKQASSRTTLNMSITLKYDPTFWFSDSLVDIQ